MLNKQEIEMINGKIKMAEERLAILKNKESIAMLTDSNYHKGSISGKLMYIGYDYATDIKIIEDYIYLLKEKLILNE